MCTGGRGAQYDAGHDGHIDTSIKRIVQTLKVIYDNNTIVCEARRPCLFFYKSIVFALLFMLVCFVVLFCFFGFFCSFVCLVADEQMGNKSYL